MCMTEDEHLAFIQTNKKKANYPIIIKKEAKDFNSTSHSATKHVESCSILDTREMQINPQGNIIIHH